MESLVSSVLGVLSPGVWEAGFRREVGVCAGSFPVGGSGGQEHNGNSPLDATLLKMLLGMWWKLLWRWWARLQASYIPEEKNDVPGTSLFRKSFLDRECAVGPVCGTGRGSCGRVIDPVQTYPTRYSSVWARKSGSFPAFFRYSLILILPLAPQQLACCVRPPPL